MVKLQALQSMYFSIDGKIFQATGTEDFGQHDCIDSLLNLQTRERFKIRRSYTMSRAAKIKWLSKEQVKHLNPV